MPQKPPVVLSIAGYDPSSGAGCTADLKTFAAHGVYGTTCITALTIQSTQGVKRVKPLAPDWVWESLAHLLDDMPPAAVRIGMLGSAEVAEVVAEIIRENRLKNIVLDPVMRSSSGASLLEPKGRKVLVEQLIPLATVITPNLDEAGVLAGMDVFDLETMREAAARLHDLKAKNVVVTGGHLAEARDLLSLGTGRKQKVSVLSGEHVKTRCTHGTGCAFAAAIAANLALGRELRAAIAAAKDFVTGALQGAYQVGSGVAPVNHMYRQRSKG